MAIAIACKECGRRYQVREQFAGRRIPCKSCGATMAVPAAGPLEITEYGDGSPVESGSDPFDDYFGEVSASPVSRPRPKRRPRSQPARNRQNDGSKKTILVVLSIFGGLALLLTIGVLLYRFVQNPSEDPKDPADGFSIAKTSVPSFPDLPQPRILGQSRAKVYSVKLGNVAGNGSGPGERMTMRVYLPDGDHADKSLGCVLVAPAGSNLLSGNNLDGGDYHDETLPYVRAGYAVVFYSIDGPIRNLETATESEMKSAYKDFKAAKAGVVNARNALEFVLARMPQVDPDRIFSAGHSSAGTLSLLFAAHEPRLKGCIAYAPVTDLEDDFSEIIASWDANDVFPGIKDFAKRSSPKTHADKIQASVFLFNAADDSRVSMQKTSEYVRQLKGEGKTVAFVSAPSGGHYNSMIQRGIPAAIAWMKTLPNEGGTTAEPSFGPDGRQPPPSTNPPGNPSPPIVNGNSPRNPPPTTAPPRTSPPPSQSPPRQTVKLVATFRLIQYRGTGDIAGAARRIFRQFSTYEISSVQYDAERKEITVDVRGNFADTDATKSALQRGGFVIGGTTVSTSAK